MRRYRKEVERNVIDDEKEEEKTFSIGEVTKFGFSDEPLSSGATKAKEMMEEVEVEKPKKKKAKKSQKAIAMKMQAAATMLEFSGKSFRLLAFQPLSISLEFSIPFELTIQNIKCHLALRPAHSDKASQLNKGGTYIAIEFSTEKPTDLFPATQTGLDLIKDFLAAISLVEGAAFREVKPIQIMIIDQKDQQELIFMHFLNFRMNHWHKPISKETFHHIQSILAHWDGLDSGKRLRLINVWFKLFGFNLKSRFILFNNYYFSIWWDSCICRCFPQLTFESYIT